MQLTAMIAQPPPAAGNSPLLRLHTILRTPPLPASAGATQPSLGASLLGGVATKQNAYLANQQLLGEISSALGARLSDIGTKAWAMLRGAPEADAAQQ
jgi:hypothetical protein